MKNHITRRHALALSGAAFATSCADNKVVLVPSAPIKDTTAPGAWSSGPTLPFPVQEIYPCAHENEIHLAGGFIAENGAIRGPTASHQSLRPMAVPIDLSPSSSMQYWKNQLHLPHARHHPHLLSFKERLVVLAGFESPSANAAWKMQTTGWSLEVGPYPDDITNGTIEYWSDTKALPAPCAEAVVGVLGNGALHLAGGRTPNGEANANWNDHGDTDHHFVLTELNGQWEIAAPCLTKRNSAAGDVIDGNLHVVGGRTVIERTNVATHEVYDHKEDRWRNAAPMPQAQGGLAAAAVGGKLYAFGGEFFDNGGGVYPESWMYDPATDAWSAIPDMPNPRHGLGALALDGKIYVIGGALQASGVDTSAIVDIFTPALKY